MNKRWSLVLLPLVLILSFFGCVDPNQLPIFYTLETEIPVEENRGLAANLHAHKLVGDATITTRYFLAAVSLFTRLPGAGTSWSKIPPPVAGALCTTIELWDDGGGLKLWAGWYDKDTGAGLGLYSLDATLFAGVVPGWTASDWTADPNVGAPEMVGLLEAPRGTELLVATSSTPGGANVLHYYGAGPAFDTGGPLIASSAKAIVDAAWDSTNTRYWVVAGTTLYAGISGTPLATQVITGITDTGAKFGGVLYDAADDDLYLSSESGRVLRYAGVSTTQTPTTSGEIVVDSDTVKFTRLVDVSTTGEVYVGTKGYGYYVIPATGVVTTLTRKPASNISGLYNGAVNSFLLDALAAPNALFVCTSKAGLWRADYTAGEWVWKQEKESD